MAQSRCRFLLVAQVCPTAIPNRPRHPFRLLTGPSSVAIDVHGSLDRAKDVSSSCGGRVAGAPSGVECVRLAYADDVPLLVLPEDTRLSSVRRTWGKSPVTHVERTDRGPCSCDIPRRMPPTPWTRVPSTVAATGTGEDRSSSFPAPASRSRRPHIAHRLGTSVCRLGIASVDPGA